MTETPKRVTYWATAGTKATCPNGHVVAHFAEPLMEGERVDPDRHLTGWLVSNEDRAAFRCSCGAMFLSGYGATAKLFVANEWVPGEQPLPEVEKPFVSFAEAWAAALQEAQKE